jgi:hypothetical protein
MAAGLAAATTEMTKLCVCVCLVRGTILLTRAMHAWNSLVWNLQQTDMNE